MPSACRHIRNLCGIDITKAPLEVGPSCHYSNGGVRVDPASCASSVPGLFAVGEVAAGLGPFASNGTENPYVILEALQHCMHRLVGVVNGGPNPRKDGDLA